ncbi:MAG TPA: SBBP repeat-containing protein [Candidatus Sulfotelmatobacter sp.]|nr:SBBP repeat-containing protein [Candidatus Sulfotelmatobacter sp.]
MQKTNDTQDFDAILTKFNPDGSALIYSTYLGGSNFGPAGGNLNFAFAIAVDSNGNAIITGSTQSADFPTVHAIQSTLRGSENAFVAKINAAGNALIYSTYLGGNSFDRGMGVAVDSLGNVYVTGETDSTDFPLQNALQPKFSGGANDAFVTKINPSGSSLIYSTYLGGSNGDNFGNGIAADSSGNAYVAGFTNTADFPLKNPLQSSPVNGFVTKINASGSALVYSTYLGGNGSDSASAIAVDSAGNAYVAGTTDSSDFPLKNALQPSSTGFPDAFVTKLNPTGDGLVYSTYLGGSGGDGADAIAVDAAGNAYLTGRTSSTDFPTVNAFQATKRGEFDAFVTELNAAGSALIYSTHLGGSSNSHAQASGIGIAVNRAGTAYIAGDGNGLGIPATPAAFQQPPLRGMAIFVAKIAQQTFVGFSPTNLSFSTKVLGQTSRQKQVTVTNKGANSLTIHKVSIVGPNASDFALTSTCGTILAPSGTCTATFTFTPTGINVRRGWLVISDSDQASPQTLALAGTGTEVSLSSGGLLFGDVAVGTASSAKTVTLTNGGGTALSLTGITIAGTSPGDFSQTNTCGTSVAAKGQCTISVTFKPSAIGKRTAGVRINDNGGASPQSISLSGTGT